MTNVIDAIILYSIYIWIYVCRENYDRRDMYVEVESVQIL